MSSFVTQSDAVRWGYNFTHLKCPYPLMKYSQLLKSGAMVAINR